MSNTVNKIKDALHLNKDHTHDNTHTHNNVPEGAAGPHNTRVANAADPRVDSDRDGSNHLGGNTYTSTGYTGTGVTGAHTTGSTNHGPHDSNLLNKADPRVDSDRDGSHNLGANTHTTTGYTGTTGSTNHGPHNSNLLNKADPRVDSDRDGSHNLGANTHTSTGYNGTGVTGGHTTGYSGTQAGNHLPGQHTGTTGGISHSTNAGPHDSNLANKVDPRVDSDLSGSGNRHGAATGGVFGTSGSHATAGSGTAQNTAGPHNSDTLNKLDPRVDADLDGSRTFGGNQTHA